MSGSYGGLKRLFKSSTNLKTTEVEKGEYIFLFQIYSAEKERLFFLRIITRGWWKQTKSNVQLGNQSIF